MSKTIAIIPARGNSKRLPKKNVKILGDVPLIAHSINYAISNSDIIDEIYVTTDCDEIKRIALDFGAKVIDRPKELSGDLEPTITALKHAISDIEDVGLVILLQPTNPFRPLELLKEAYKIFVNNNINSLFTVSRDYRKYGKIIANKFKPFNYKIGQRSQDIDPLYFENGLLYITKASLIEEDIIFDELSYSLIVNHKFAEVDIDSQEDFDYAEYILENYNEE
ncbi:cytidylyltransferase domain-containing protein [Winogradskyella sp. PG-2]|uniref:acylneuraminate cytidylyltransferase family protein n=1 Tax=Winogradskyella sp. PG-2 TaxID=754409 RepID=UPI0004587FEE|nr:acylneuraminate cytidylyltransferase family protein [Winogradskyella sp. PG-2]BAO74402.1 N-acetylneuraminate cytidylyltransferase [Winogradskyella sp. PG-2]